MCKSLLATLSREYKRISTKDIVAVVGKLVVQNPVEALHKSTASRT